MTGIIKIADIISKETEGVNNIEIPCYSKVLHEVKIFDSKGKLKKVISEKAIHKRHWAINALEAKAGKGFTHAGPKEIRESLAIEQFEDE